MAYIAGEDCPMLDSNRSVSVEVSHRPLPLGARFRANAEIMLAW